jgi:signal transduction histidine kinase
VALPSGRRLLLGALVVSLCATAALAIGILLFGDFGETEGRVLATTAAISFYSLLALPGGILLDQGRIRPLAWATFALAAAAFAVAMMLVWGELESETLAKVLLTLSAYALAATQTSATGSRLRAAGARAVRALFAASTLLVLALATMVAVAAWAEIDRTGYFRLLAALAVANVLLVVLQPIARRLAGGPSQTAFRLRLTHSGGEEQERSLAARDLAEAAARAIREAERDGGEVARIERLSGP